METRYNIMFTYQEIEYLKNNLDMVPKVEEAIQNLSPRHSYLILKDLAESSPNLTSKVRKHVMSLFDQLLYPKFTAVVKNLKSFVQNDTQVMNALLLYSGYSSSEILSKLEFGSGQNIAILTFFNAYGQFNRLVDPDLVEIDTYWVQQLEQAYSIDKTKAFGFLLVVVSMYEFVHQARYLNGLTNDYENGVGFENVAFGLRITYINASSYSYRFYKK